MTGINRESPLPTGVVTLLTLHLHSLLSHSTSTLSSHTPPPLSPLRSAVDFEYQHPEIPNLQHRQRRVKSLIFFVVPDCGVFWSTQIKVAHNEGHESSQLGLPFRKWK